MSVIEGNILECVDDAGLRGVLNGMINEAGTQRAFADEIGISTAYLSDILAGHRPVAALAERLGYRPVTVFVDVDETAVSPSITAKLVRELIARMRRSAAS